MIQSSETADKLGNKIESCKFLEKAVAISVKTEGFNSFDIVLSLANKYKKYSMIQKCIWVLMEYTQTVPNDLRNDQLLYEISQCYMKIKNFSSAIKGFHDVLKSTSNEVIH